MTKRIGLVLAGIGVFIFFLLYFLPASQVLGRVQLPPNIQIGEVSGRIWEGRASAVSVSGLVVEDVKWDMQVLPLLWGQLSFEVDAGNARAADDISFSGPISTSVFSTGTLRTQDLKIFLPSALVIAQLPLPVPVNAGGRFRVQIDELDFDQQCQSLTGKGQWLNASFMGMGEPLQLGNFDADLSCEDGMTLIQINEPNSFGLSAVARVPADLQISVEGRFKPADHLPRDVHEAAKFFGQPDSDGYYELIF